MYCKFFKICIVYSYKFQKEGLTKDDYKEWMQERTDDKKAYRKMCRKFIDLSNMGQRAFISRMKSKKHSDLVTVRSGTSAQQSIETCFCTSSTSKAVDSTSVTDSYMGSSEDNDDRRSLVSAHVITDYAISLQLKLRKLKSFGQS